MLVSDRAWPVERRPAGRNKDNRAAVLPVVCPTCRSWNESYQRHLARIAARQHGNISMPVLVTIVYVAVLLLGTVVMIVGHAQ